MKRKTDRRTLMTKQMIKDALLELLAHTPYEKVTVSALCRQAEITRATFYLHYDNTESVLSELLDDALRLTELADRPQEPWTGELLEKPEAAATPADLDAMLPACQRAASNPKYRVLFLDESLSRHILQKLADFQRPRRVPQIMMTGVWKAVAFCQGVVVVFHSPAGCAHVASFLDLGERDAVLRLSRRRRLRGSASTFPRSSCSSPTKSTAQRRSSYSSPWCRSRGRREKSP